MVIPCAKPLRLSRRRQAAALNLNPHCFGRTGRRRNTELAIFPRSTFSQSVAEPSGLPRL
jgi:hypothetical protein